MDQSVNPQLQEVEELNNVLKNLVPDSNYAFRTTDCESLILSHACSYTERPYSDISKWKFIPLSTFQKVAFDKNPSQFVSALLTFILLNMWVLKLSEACQARSNNDINYSVGIYTLCVDISDKSPKAFLIGNFGIGTNKNGFSSSFIIDFQLQLTGKAAFTVDPANTSYQLKFVGSGIPTEVEEVSLAQLTMNSFFNYVEDYATRYGLL